MSDLGNECDEVAKLGSLLVRLELENGEAGLIVAELLDELVLVRSGIALDEVLQLGYIGGQQGGPISFTHGSRKGKTKVRGRGRGRKRATTFLCGFC